MTLQYRPAGSSDPAYCPERDIGWALESVVHMLPTVLSSTYMPAWIGAHVKEHGVSDQQLQRAIDAFLAGVANCRDPEIRDVKDTLSASGFWDLPDAHKLPVFSALGIVLFSYYFKAVREATLSPDVTIPKLVLATPDMVDALAAGKEELSKEAWYTRWMKRTKEARRSLGQ